MGRSLAGTNSKKKQKPDKVDKLDYSKSWTRIITTDKNQVYRCRYDKSKGIVYTNTLDKSGNIFLSLMDLPEDRFEKFYNCISIVSEEIK